MNEWPDAKTEKLKTMWLDGASGQDIADELKTTRNAVMGKIARLGLHHGSRTRDQVQKWAKKRREKKLKQAA